MKNKPSLIISPDDYSWAAETKTIIWDMDLTLYEFDERFIQTCWESSYNVAMQFIPGLQESDAKEKCRASWDKYHSGYDFLFHDYNIPQAPVLTAWHANLDESFIKPVDKSFIEKMKLAAENHIIITHGSREWSHRVIKRRNLQSVFSDDDIISFEDIFPDKKNVNMRSYDMAIVKTKCNPAHTPVVEDSQVNLLMAKNRGLVTVAVHQKPDAKQESFTDHMIATPEMLLDRIIEVKNARTLVI